MKECPECGNIYPEEFQDCPADKSPLRELAERRDSEPAGIAAPTWGSAQISVRTLMLALGLLFAIGLVPFIFTFAYQYLKPKYGGLVVKTTPPGAVISIDGKQRGITPLTAGSLRSGVHQIKISKEGYKDLVQQVEVLPYATENLHWRLDPLVLHLTNEQLAEIEAWGKKLDNAQRENIILPPPEDYNVLYFANKILAIDPANAYALDVKNKLGDSIRHNADVAYATENWLEAEKQYKNLSLLFPEDMSINERLTDIAAKIDASLKDRDKQVEDWKAKAESAIKAGNLGPPEKDNALEALRNIQRLDQKNVYARGALAQVKEMLQNRGDTRLNSGDYQGARNDFRLVLQFFPEDAYSKSRLAAVEAKLGELAQAEQLRLQRSAEEQQSRQRLAAMRQSAVNSYRSGAYQKSISEWLEYLKMDANSDEAYFYLGECYQDQQQYDTAILNFEKCVALNAGNAQAHLDLAILYDRHRNDFKQADEHLKKAKDLGGTDKYSIEKIQTMIQDLQERAQLDSLQKLPFAVEHKHAFSSCRGQLRITEEGVEFKTEETDHSFYEPYSALRSFAVENGEISLRTQNNKKYNFRLVKPGDAALVRRLAARHFRITG
jgi:tetratricopeptide (TPR) repeat protein